VKEEGYLGGQSFDKEHRVIWELVRSVLTLWKYPELFASYGNSGVMPGRGRIEEKDTRRFDKSFTEATWLRHGDQLGHIISVCLPIET